jgi:hypothetical protein
MDPSPKAIARASRFPFVIHAMLRGSVGFGIVSLAAFSVWAVAGKWFQARFGEAGLFCACALVFLGLSGPLLHRLVLGSGSLLRFYEIFLLAFVAYVVVWCAAWFILHFGLGEWLGSLLGTAAFVAVTGWSFRNYRGSLKAILILFGLHSAGYFLGGRLMYWLAGPTGSAMLVGVSRHGVSVLAKLAWGLLYGLGFGAGIGYAFHIFQHERNQPVPAKPKQRIIDG